MGYRRWTEVILIGQSVKFWITIGNIKISQNTSEFIKIFPKLFVVGKRKKKIDATWII